MFVSEADARNRFRHVRRRTMAVLATAAVAGAVTLTGVGSAQADDTAPLANGVSIDVGGSGGGTFVADSYGTGGIQDTMPAGTASLPNFGATVAHPIPAGIWDTSRFTDSSYTIPGLTPGGTYQVRLYFLDWYYQHPGLREFNVDLDGTQVLTDFDITRTADNAGADGQESFGVEKDFPVTVDSTGTVTLDFLRGDANQVQINAIAIVPTS